jgi:hypothetical protein
LVRGLRSASRKIRLQNAFASTAGNAGALFVKRDSAGRETWYGRWRVGATQLKRRIGPKRIPSTREGLTRTQAEAELRRMIGSIDHLAAGRDRVTVEQVGQLLIASLQAKGRKRATIETYGSALRVQLVPFFGARTLDRIGRREIEAFIAHMSRTGRSPKTTLNALGILHSIFEYARREGWVASNPCTLVRQAAGIRQRPRHPLPRARGGGGAPARRPQR